MNKYHSALGLALLSSWTFSSCVQAQEEMAPEPSPETEAAAPKSTAKAKAVKAAPAGKEKQLHVRAGSKNGDGSAQKPFGTIQQAVDVARGGDTVVVEAGTYEGGITVNGAYPDGAPLTIRAAEGAQPVISGMKSITGWKVEADGIYTVEVEGKAKSLFAGASRMALSSWPKSDETWLKPATIDVATKTVTYAGPAPAKITKDTKLYTFEATKQTFAYQPVQSVSGDGAQSSILLSDASVERMKLTKVNKFTFFNSPSFITRPDEWAAEYPDATRTRISFKPKNADELKNTQYRSGGTGIGLSEGAANVKISGFTITGMNGSAIGVRGAKKVTVEDCVLYNNDTGIGGSNVSDITLRRNVVMQNYWGIGFFDGDHILMDECEVAFNDEDGIRVSGRIWDKESNKLGSADIQFKRSYIHHHQYQGHPDNIQFFRGVGRTQIEDCLLMFGGQQLMMEQTADMKLANSVVLSSINRSLNLFSYKTPEGKGWNLEHNTVGYTRYAPAVFGGQNNRSYANLFFNFSEPVTLPSDGAVADYDWFAPNKSAKASFSIDKKAKFSSIADFGSRGGLQANGKIGAPQLRNVPASMSVAFGTGGSSNERLTFDTKSASDTFAVGDLIEINGDAVPRTVKTVEGSAITFSPALPAAPFRYSNVFNWKNNSNFQIDTRPATGSPLLISGPEGKTIGASLNVAAYQKGDFDGDGKRDLPQLPKELADLLGERPNRYIYPYSL